MVMGWDDDFVKNLSMSIYMTGKRPKVLGPDYVDSTMSAAAWGNITPVPKKVVRTQQ